MDENDFRIISNKVLMIQTALSELPENIRGLKIRDITYDHINIICNCLASVFSVDVRPFWAAFNREWSGNLQLITKDLYGKESFEDRPIGQMVSFPWYCAFILANAQYNLAGSGSLQQAISGNTQSNIAHCIKISQSNANVMFQAIYGLNITGTKPSGCAIFIFFGISLIPIGATAYKYLA